MLEVDQDPLGRQAERVYKNGEAEAWSKMMEDESQAVGLFNRSDTLIRIEVPWDSLGLKGKQRIRDLWRQKNLGTFETSFEADVRAHGVVLVRIFPKEKK